ncbi:MAG: hypothetical protein SWH78_16555 [Thermodesulfobacteriota bacterium]|nr:hypothetical protein [Thermodesulfobacteriota bacterium]
MSENLYDRLTKAQNQVSVLQGSAQVIYEAGVQATKDRPIVSEIYFAGVADILQDVIDVQNDVLNYLFKEPKGGED